MSLHSAPLDLDNFAESDSTGLSVNLDLFSYWATHGYPVDDIIEAYSVVNEKVGDENSSHVVLKVQTLSKPLDRADAAVDQTTLFVCDCRDYRFNLGVDLEQKSVTSWGQCKHVLECSKSAKAKQDEQQSELGY